ncbi:MAG: hypothetical protein OJF49_002871 [Ktedonobacterales bacterium]|jgi:glycosyltransferase involved in cell wall biosynthesis|nr:MAG: hypothetical protein OJF49_002871 [Ktedonobacterales bacterium]
MAAQTPPDQRNTHAGAATTATATAPLRVLYLMEGFESGGAEHRFVRMARALDRDRFALSIGALRLGGPLQPAMEATGVPLVPFTRRSRFDLSPVLRLRSYLRAEHIDVVHAMHWLSNLTATLATTTLPHVAVIGSTVGMVYDASRGGRARLALDHQTWRRMDRMTVNSEALRTYLLGHGFPERKLSVVLNGVDLPDAARLPAARAEARARLSLAPETPLVGILARLTPVKDHPTFLRAAQIVHQRMPAARFALVGDGPERPALEALARDLGIAEAVIFTGHVASSDLVLPAFDVAVLSSRHEGMPNALLEAGAWGVPLVSTPVGGAPEIAIDGQTGLLAPVGDAPALADRILTLLSDPASAHRLGAAARDHIAARFSTATMMHNYESVYTEVAADRRKGHGS